MNKRSPSTLSIYVPFFTLKKLNLSNKLFPWCSSSFSVYYLIPSTRKLVSIQHKHLYIGNILDLLRDRLCLFSRVPKTDVDGTSEIWSQACVLRMDVLTVCILIVKEFKGHWAAGSSAPTFQILGVQPSSVHRAPWSDGFMHAKWACC